MTMISLEILLPMLGMLIIIYSNLRGSKSKGLPLFISTCVLGCVIAMFIDPNSLYLGLLAIVVGVLAVIIQNIFFKEKDEKDDKNL